jgi:hypothetical protein
MLPENGIWSLFGEAISISFDQKECLFSTIGFSVQNPPGCLYQPGKWPARQFSVQIRCFLDVERSRLWEDEHARARTKTRKNHEQPTN